MHQRKTSEWNRRAHGRIKLLIEDPRAVWFSDFERFRAGGFEVAVCTGPAGGCTLLGAGRCDLVDGADVVVNATGAVDDEGRRLVEVLRLRRPDMPVVVEVPREEMHADSPPELPAGCTALPFPTSVEGQMRALRRALVRR